MAKKGNAADKVLENALNAGEKENDADLSNDKPLEKSSEISAGKVAVEKKGKKVKQYFARYMGFSFCYKTYRNDGKPAYVTNRTTGLPLTDGDGLPRPVLKMETFMPLVSKMSKGYLSTTSHDFSDNSPNNVSRGEELERLAAKEDIKMYDRDTHEKMVNNPMWIEKQAREDAENRASAAEAANAKLQAELDKLKRD